MSAIIITKDNFEEEVLKATQPVLVDFWATWCMPCQSMLPIVEELAADRPDVKICKVNVDEQMELARKFKVMSIPTFLAFKNGQVVAHEVGTQEKAALERMLDK